MVKQLREHFKALKEEIRQNMVQEDDEEDDVDIDNMTYEVNEVYIKGIAWIRRKYWESVKGSCQQQILSSR